MIGRIYVSPSFSNKGINHNNNNNKNPKKTLTNQITGSIINVKSSKFGFRTISQELSLYRDVKNNPMLAYFADDKLHNSQNARLSSLGMAVTAIYNMVENGKAKEQSVVICDENPRNQLMELNLDPSMTERGAEYINQCIDNKTPLDPTNYAIGLGVGSDITKGLLDPNMVEQFNLTWNKRIDMAT